MPTMYSRTPPPTWGSATRLSGNWTFGARFQVTGETTCTAISWYRTGTTWGKPAGLLLYENIGTNLIDISAGGVPDSTGAGWKTLTLVSPIALHPGRTYTVCIFTNDNGMEIASTATVNRGPPGAGFILDDIGSYSTNSRGFPMTPDAGTTYGVDITIGTAPEPTPPGPDDPATAGEISSWLSSDPATQTHETDGLPWLTKVVADSIATGQASARIVIDATKDIVELIPKRTDSEWSVVQKLWQIAGVLTEAEIDLWNLHAKRAPSQLTGPTPGGGSAFFGPSGRQVAEAAEGAAGDASLIWHRTRTSNWLEPLPGEDWELLDTLEWDAPFSWNQPADCYVVHLTAVPTYVTAEDVAGTAYYSKAAWWAPLTGTLPHERHYCEFEYQVLHNLPLRCSGILFRPRNNFAGTIEAWQRPTPPMP